jgi:amidase
MTLEEYVHLDATALGRLVSQGDVTAAELAQLARQAHDRVNPVLNAIIEFYDDAETAAGADAGPFRGVPFLRKDLGASEAGRLQERGSRLFQGCRAATDSFYFKRAREGGLRVIGRTTTPELGVSGFSESYLHGVTRNPWNIELTAGGSSSGASAAVAAGIAPMAHGGDGGGSIRTPAAWCGLVGLNPSRGRISGGPDRQDTKFGLARQFVICRTVRDMAAALDVFAGSFPGDPIRIIQPERPYAEELERPTGRLRVGVAFTSWTYIKVEPDVSAAVERTARVLAACGHQVEEIPSPYVASDYARILIGMAHLAAGDLERVAKQLQRTPCAATLEPINLKLFESGRQKPLSEAGETFEVLRRMRFEVGQALSQYDILLTPVMPTKALPHGGVFCATNDHFSAQEWMEADAALYQFLGIFNVTGQPSVSLPVAHSADGLPIGVQVVARFGDEATLVRVSRDLEEALPWTERLPPIHAGHRVPVA